MPGLPRPCMSHDCSVPKHSNNGRSTLGIKRCGICSREKKNSSKTEERHGRHCHTHTLDVEGTIPVEQTSVRGSCVRMKKMLAVKSEEFPVLWFSKCFC